MTTIGTITAVLGFLVFASALGWFFVRAANEWIERGATRMQRVIMVRLLPRVSTVAFVGWLLFLAGMVMRGLASK